MSLCKVSLSEVLRRRTPNKIEQAYEHWSQDDDDGRDDEEDNAGDEDLHDVEVLAHLFPGQQNVAQEQTQERRSD